MVRATSDNWQASVARRESQTGISKRIQKKRKNIFVRRQPIEFLDLACVGLNCVSGLEHVFSGRFGPILPQASWLHSIRVRGSDQDRDPRSTHLVDVVQGKVKAQCKYQE
ncbi:hypothetical protein EYF80_042706 [Liparis tanakae]|uniref:Uncharacterized protein n=1 Tax=Liparis tanakae TaxID=230148 RepID=A0A4Z2G2L3_9TELE|nr:hypothetical protein EYF80_042706 [Liparis tanakae]